MAPEHRTTVAGYRPTVNDLIELDIWCSACGHEMGSEWVPESETETFDRSRRVCLECRDSWDPSQPCIEQVMAEALVRQIERDFPQGPKAS